MKWTNDKSNLYDVAVKQLGAKERVLPKCCAHPEVHIYAWRHDKKGGRRNSAWVWCSNCGAYAHIDGILLHDDWEDSLEIDNSQLTAIPDYQESKKTVIDKHMARFMKVG